MTELEKSLALAKLMGWELRSNHERIEAGMVDFEITNDPNLTGTILCPYKSNPTGLSQFAAILLKYPEVMVSKGRLFKGDPTSYNTWEKEPTQQNILDEILRMNGVEV